MANERRLIDANALRVYRGINVGANLGGLKAIVLEKDIRKAPTVDAVEVVRCKDCKHMSIEPIGRYCFAWGAFNGMGDEGFCNYGERREGE